MAKELIRSTTVKADIEAETEKMFETFEADLCKVVDPMSLGEHIEFRNAFIKYSVFMIDEEKVDSIETVKHIATLIVQQFVKIYTYMLATSPNN